MFSVSLEYLVAIFVILTTIILSIQYTKQRGVIVANHDGIRTMIVSDTASCIQAINDLKKLNPYILGLDCEWVGNHKVSLLQLGHSKLIVLIRIHKLKTIPVELIGLMNNNKILKTGVGIYNDIKKLRNDYMINVNGVVDINHILPLITNFNELLNNYYGDIPAIYTCQQTFGLNRLSQIILKQKMKYKDKKITISNWEINSLTQKQISYAADDAIIGWNLFKKCMQLENISHDIEEYLSFCFGRMDVTFSRKHKTKNINKITTKTNEQISKKNARKVNHKQKHKTHFFDNCKLLKPNGSLLFYCSVKSMQWYLRKELAQVVDDKTVKLKFEPKIKNEESLDHYKTTRINQCFVCGKKGSLCQYDVVPKQYRSCMDMKYRNKGWRLHDYIPLCTFCHPIALKMQSILVEELCEKYSDKVPYYRIKKGNTKHNLLCKAQRAAKALQKQNSNIPIKRKIELLQILCDYFGLKYNIIYCQDEKKNEIDSFDELITIVDDESYGSETTTNIINECIGKLQIKVEEQSNKSQWELHAKAMLEVYKNKQPAFIEMWRKHFKHNMKPQHLPDTWSVDTSNMLNH